MAAPAPVSVVVAIPIGDHLALRQTLTEAVLLAIAVDTANKNGQGIPVDMTQSLRGLLLALHNRMEAAPFAVQHMPEHTATGAP